MIKIAMSQLRHAASKRPRGYLDDVVSRGKIEGELLILTDESFKELQRKYSPSVQNKQKGLGDKIESVAKPIAKAIDKVVGTNVSNCGSCKKMRERLNAGMTIPEATEIRAIEFAIRKLDKRRKSIFKKVDARLKAKGQ